MKIDVVMPKMGESVNEGTIIKWHKKKGDKVLKDEILFEISTDKVDTEIPSPAEGVLTDIKVYEQETVDVDTVVAVIDDNANGNAAPPAKETAPVKETAPEKNEEKKEERSTTQVGGELIDIPMPKMGESVMEGTIIKWLKKPGDAVKKDELLFEISTDKVDTEVPSPEEGTLAEILVNEQETVEVGVTVARVSKKGGIVQQKPPAAKQEQREPVKEVKEAAPEPVQMKKEEKPKQSGGGFYSPLVMNIAQKENVGYDELELIEGTGVEGRVTKKDILSYVESRGKGTPKPRTRPTEERTPQQQEITSEPVEENVTQPSGNGVELIPMDNIRQKIMQHMVKSRDTSVHVAGITEVDVTRIHNIIKNSKDGFLKRENVKLTYMAFIAEACIKALKSYPYMNASIDGTNIVQKKYVNLGFAVALEPNGLIVPNIKNASEKNLTGLAKAINELSTKARTKKLTPDDISNGTFTITNYGIFGTLFGTPIINQPEVAILGVGTVTKRPVVIEVDGSDTIAVRHMMFLSLSHDHRLVDGMLGGKFLKYIKDYLENYDNRLI